jgi:hypothetical protein
MTQSNHFSSPADYRIEARGYLSPDWYGRFGLMQVISYELHLSLLSVQCLKGG